MFSDLNLSWLAIFIAALAHIAVDLVWLHPKAFGETWANSMQVNNQPLAPKAFLTEALLALVLSFVLALFIDWTGSQTSWEGAVVAFWAFIGFVLPTQYAQVTWAKKPLTAFYLESARMLTSLLLMGALIGMLN